MTYQSANPEQIFDKVVADIKSRIGYSLHEDAIRDRIKAGLENGDSTVLTTGQTLTYNDGVIVVSDDSGVEVGRFETDDHCDAMLNMLAHAANLKAAAKHTPRNINW